MTGQIQFREELDELKRSVLEMAGRAEEAVRLAVEALVERDAEKAGRVISGDHTIDDIEMDIDDRVVHLLALQQPMASDLRLIMCCMRMSNDLERVGDHAVNIAEQVEHLVQLQRISVLPEINEMVKIASGMLNDALSSFTRRDSALARDVVIRDDSVDDLHRNVFRILLTQMMENPRSIGPSMDLLLVSRNIERIADLATNLAEDVVYLVEGRMIKHHAEESEATPAPPAPNHDSPPPAGK